MSAFCNNELDVMIEAVGLPNANYDYLATECDATYIDLKQNIIDSFTKNPYLRLRSHGILFVSRHAFYYFFFIITT